MSLTKAQKKAILDKLGSATMSEEEWAEALTGEKKMKSFKEHRDNLDELARYSDKQIKMAFGIINDPRYKGGNMTAIVKKIEQIAKGLSKHPSVVKAIKVTNEEYELDEGRVRDQKSYKAGQEAAKKGVKYDDNPNTKGSQAFLDWSKGHNQARAKKMGIKEEMSHETKVKWQKVATELGKYAQRNGGIDKKDMQDVADMFMFNTRIKDTKDGYEPQKILNKIMMMDTDPRDKIIEIITKVLGTKWKNSRPSAKEIFGKYLGEEMELDEAKGKYEVNHKTYTSAVQEALKYCADMGYEVDEDEYFDKVATGPRKPSEGKTNRFSISLTKKGKPQRKALQIQIYGKGKSGYELNCYIN